MGHETYSDRALAELEAESSAFIVMRTLNVDSGDYSFGYCASWAGGGNEAIAAIKASGTRIQHAAKQILDALDPSESPEDTKGLTEDGGS